MKKSRLEDLDQREERKGKRDFIMLPVVDFCFKELMKNPVVRKGFIAALLGLEPEQVEGTELLPNEQPGDYPDEKTGILDVLVRFREGGRINLEMQVLLYAYWRERVLFYLSRIYASQIKQGGSYQNLKKCIHVSVLAFQQFPEDQVCFRVFHMKEEGADRIYSDKLEIIVMELPKLPPEAQTEEGVLSWMRFFSGKKKEEKKEESRQPVCSGGCWKRAAWRKCGGP